FVKAITTGLTKPPQYFSMNAKINREGYQSIDLVISNGMKAFSVSDFETEMNKNNTVVIDTRHQDVFEKGFIPGSVFIGLNGRFAEWVGTVLNIEEHFLIVADEGKEKEVVTRMARVGYDNISGFLSGGFEAWKNANKKIDMLISIDADEMLLDYKHDEIKVIDVRKETEFESGHVEGAMNVVLNDFENHVEKLNDQSSDQLYVHCLGGYRSMIAASLLKRKGFNNLRNIKGGWEAIQKTQIPVVMPQFSAS
ncbi:MAG: MBL fold metallo-hydrolase, partial [Chitinophagales bacterium]|nr:MBL fold metallo-hydrolase [Chitinophagales bacterium]